MKNRKRRNDRKRYSLARSAKRRDALDVIQEEFGRALRLSGGKLPSFARISNV